jgi:hypothetical protein
MQFTVLEPLLDFGDGVVRAFGIGEIDLDVILRPHFPRAVFRKGMPRAGDHAPPGCRKSLDCGVADPTARAGEQERTARLVRVRRRHGGLIQKSSAMLKGFALRRHCAFWR